MFSETFQNLKKYIQPKKETFTELPSGVKRGLDQNLTPGEKVLLTIRDFRAIYKAPRWVDSNTWFNSWFILTSQRVIIAKYSSSLKKLRDIPLDIINRTDFEKGDAESKLVIETPTTTDTIEFQKETKEYLINLDMALNKAIELYKKDKEQFHIVETLLCFKCGSKVPKESKFCPECGESLRQKD